MLNTVVPDPGVLATQEIFDDDLGRIPVRHHLTLSDAARACALTTAWLVKKCAPRIGAETGFNIAAYGFVEGTKPSAGLKSPADSHDHRFSRP